MPSFGSRMAAFCLPGCGRGSRQAADALPQQPAPDNISSARSQTDAKARQAPDGGTHDGPCRSCFDFNAGELHKDRAVEDMYVDVRCLRHTAARGCERCGLVLQAVSQYGDVIDISRDPRTSDRTFYWQVLAEGPPTTYLEAVDASFAAIGAHQPWLDSHFIVSCFAQREPGTKFAVVVAELKRSTQRSDTPMMELERTFTLELFSAQRGECPWPQIPVSNLVALDTSTAQTVETVRGWLTECSKKHTKCRGTDPPPLPRRVLDLAAFGNQDASDVKLVETSPGQRDRYICLSYCWGLTPQRIMTTRGTYKQNTTRITWNSLGKTAQDLATVSRKLGVRYMWIDALCIIQRDTQDWSEQAGLMADIYHRAYLTIAASASTDSEGGLFHQAGPTRTLTSGAGARTPWRAHTRKFIPHLRFLDEQSHAAFPLTGRAWCFQERTLSPRILHFGPAEVVWECLTREVCECSSSTTTIPGSGGPAATRDSGRGYAQTLLANSPPTRMDVLWRSIVMEFTRLSITNQGDKYAALEGIVSLMRGRRKGEDCVAGAWAGGEALRRDLLWQTGTIVQPGMAAAPLHLATGAAEARFPVAKPRAPSAVDAPSWSWGAVDAPVMWYARYMTGAVRDKCSAKVGVRSFPYGKVDCHALIAEAYVYTVPGTELSSLMDAGYCITEYDWDPEMWEDSHSPRAYCLLAVFEDKNATFLILDELRGDKAGMAKKCLGLPLETKVYRRIGLSELGQWNVDKKAMAGKQGKERAENFEKLFWNPEKSGVRRSQIAII